MKKLTLIIAIVFSITLMQAQKSVNFNTHEDCNGESSRETTVIKFYLDGVTITNEEDISSTYYIKDSYTMEYGPYNDKSKLHKRIIADCSLSRTDPQDFESDVIVDYNGYGNIMSVKVERKYENGCGHFYYNHNYKDRVNW